MLFFKQKTAYEVRISDWSSDVCSSDLRKKLEAANAIVRPNTIWISLRNPPDVSPKASARPVAMMMMTATMRATGPWMDSRMDCSGPSHGIEERSEEHTSELQSLMRISYAVFCLKKKKSDRQQLSTDV